MGRFAGFIDQPSETVRWPGIRRPPEQAAGIAAMTHGGKRDRLACDNLFFDECRVAGGRFELDRFLVQRRRFPGARDFCGAAPRPPNHARTVVSGRSPLVLPPVLAGWLLLIMFGVRGPLGSLLWDWFGIRLVFTTAGAILATSVMTFPMIVRSVRLSFEALDPALDAAARTLGAGPFDRFIAVTLPLVAPGILAGVITAFAAGLGEFGAVIVFASNIPGLTQTLPLAIYTATEVPGGELAAAKLGAMSLLLAAVSLLLADVIARSLARRLGRR
jgi:molybdate transport system permease protein